MFDSVILGRLVDEIESEDDQTDLNERSLFLHDQEVLIKSIDRKISKYELTFLLEQIKDSSDEFWVSLLKKIIRCYSLNSLKTILSTTSSSDLTQSILRLLIFIKIELVNYIEDKMLKVEDLDREKLEEIIISMDSGNSELFMVTLSYLDKESLHRMIHKLVNESKMEYM